MILLVCRRQARQYSLVKMEKLPPSHRWFIERSLIQQKWFQISFYFSENDVPYPRIVKLFFYMSNTMLQYYDAGPTSKTCENNLDSSFIISDPIVVCCLLYHNSKGPIRLSQCSSSIIPVLNAKLRYHLNVILPDIATQGLILKTNVDIFLKIKSVNN